MKTKSASRAAFFNPRVLIGFVLCSVGLLLALAGLSKSVTGMVRHEATTQTNPVPLINQPLVPDAAAPGGPGFTLTVNGTGFVSGASINWNGGARATTFVSTSQLTASILASDIAIASTASVTVVNPSQGGGSSNIVFFPITTSTSSVSFTTSDYATGMAPNSVAVGDFNGDSKLDLAVANRGSNTVSVLLGNGDGTFQTRMDYAAGGDPISVAVGDFNGDGKLDLAVANGSDSTGNTVSLLLGNGDGTFQAHVDYQTGRRSTFVVVGDFNGDGRLDLAVGNYGPDFRTGSVSIHLGNGDGTFQPHLDYPAGVNPVGVLVGDFNQDNKLDLAVLNNNAPQGVSILLGNGDGSFQNAVLYNAPWGNPRTGMVADFDSDGKVDLAIAIWQTNNLSVLLGNGDGSFQNLVDYPAGTNPNALAGGDLNGDGKLDLVTVNYTSNNVSVLLGQGDGTFQSHVDYQAGTGPAQLAIGDFNTDGRLDIVTANSFDNTVSVLFQGTTVALSDTSLRFGLQLVGTESRAQAVTLTNTGPITLDISSITTSNDFLQTNTCGSSLPPGASCTIDVTFDPTAKGNRTGALTITDNAAGSPQTVTLTGTGTVVELSPLSVNFGDQKVGTISPPHTVTLTNTGSTPLSIRGIAILGANFGDFAQTTTCGSSVPANASCTIDVRFAPTATGTRQASMKVRDDGGGGAQRVKLAGTGTL